MKNVFVVLFILLFVGCASKPDLLALKPYEFTQGKFAKEGKVIRKVNIKKVENLALDNIGFYKQDNALHKVKLTTNMKLWLYNAMSRALQDAGHEKVYEDGADIFSLKLAIKNIKFKYENQILSVHVSILMQQYNIRKIYNIKINKNAFFEKLPNADDVENLLFLAFDESVKQIMKKISYM